VWTQINASSFHGRMDFAGGAAMVLALGSPAQEVEKVSSFVQRQEPGGWLIQGLKRPPQVQEGGILEWAADYWAVTPRKSELHFCASM